MKTLRSKLDDNTDMHKTAIHYIEVNVSYNMNHHSYCKWVRKFDPILTGIMGDYLDERIM